MSLRLQRIAFRDFRSYAQLSLEGLGLLTIFVGPNAVGKTNIAEGIQLLSALNSFRASKLSQMVRFGCEAAHLEAIATDDRRCMEISLDMTEHARKYRLNGKQKQTKDLKGLLPAVSFTPDDLNLVKGSNTGRRNAIDALGSQLSPNHYVIRKDYERVLRHKNKLLKEGTTPPLLESIDEMMTICGAQLTCYRIALLAKFIPLCSSLYEQISSGTEKLTITYRLSWSEESISALTRDEARKGIISALEKRRSEEIMRGRALIGPHADSVEFYLDGKEALLFGSQGQQRSIVLAWKLAEALIIEDILQQKPLVILDDVMSELDKQRREALMSYLSDDVQTFVTTTNVDYFNNQLLQRAHVVNLPLDREEVVLGGKKTEGDGWNR